MKVLILCPNPKDKGGVSNYYALLKKYFNSQRVHLSFYYTGMSSEPIIIKKIIKFISDLISLFTIVKRYNLIILNPSLDPKSILRDGIYHFIIKRIFHKKTLIFFRGWTTKYEFLIESYGKLLFRWILNFNHALVLSSKFKNALCKWGYIPEKITMETTAFENYYIKGNNNPYNIIFLSRFIKEKGCMEAIKIIEILSKEFPRIKLFMVGGGEMETELRRYVYDTNLNNNVYFTGWIEGREKYQLISNCGIILLPSHSEGMPNCLIEGMAMGLAVISRPIGGIPEIISDYENGFLIDSLNPTDFAYKIKCLLQDNCLWDKISNKNKRKAIKEFQIENVVKRLEKLYIEII